MTNEEFTRRHHAGKHVQLADALLALHDLFNRAESITREFAVFEGQAKAQIAVMGHDFRQIRENLLQSVTTGKLD